ncbi:hypothetical protein R0K05_23740, partial [Planococcus sp. SIMBA_160]
YIVLGLTYFPLIWLALMSISEQPLSGIPFPLSGEHYGALVADLRWGEPFVASLVIALLVALLCMVIATAVGRAIPQLKRPG